MGESDAEQETNGNASVIVGQPEESNMLPKSRNGDGSLQTAESSNENLCDHPANYPVSCHTNSEAEADPEN